MRIFAFTAARHSQFDKILAGLSTNAEITLFAPAHHDSAGEGFVGYQVPETYAAGRAANAAARFQAVAAAARDAMRRVPYAPDLVFGQASFGCIAELRSLWAGPMVAHVELPGLEYAMARCEYPLDAQGVETDRVVRAQIARCLGQADAIIAPTGYARGLLPDHLARRCTPIMEGFTVRPPLKDMEKADVLRKYGLNPALPVVGFFARTLELVRGFDRYLSAMTRVMDQNPKVQALIVGQAATIYGNEKTVLADGDTIAERLLAPIPDGIRRRMFFTGLIDQTDMHQLMDAANIAAFPIYEGAGTWGIFEAMAGATPVIAANRAFLPEIIVDGESGLLVDPDDVDALAAAVTDLVEDPRRARQFGLAGQATIKQRFTVENAVRDYRGLFQSLLSL